MPSSTLAAKQLDVRATDFATSGSTVSIKTYDASSTYSFYMPETNPKYLNGVSGSEQVANQVLTYDVSSDKYVWAQASSPELFIQGETTSVGTDENGNVLTVQSETRVVAGDPLYDPSLPADQQVFKVQQQFTDVLYNMNELKAGKPSVGGSVQYDKTTGLYFDYVQASDNPNGSTDENKQAKNKLLLTTQVGTSGSEIEKSSITLQPTSLESVYCTSAGLKTGCTFADNLLTFVSQSKSLTASELVKTVVSCYPGTSSNTATTLVHKPSEMLLTFGSDSSKLKVDNATKKMETDMTCIEFGSSSDKHRLKITGGKLHIQKYSSAQSKWVGADVVLDAVAEFVATASVSTSASGSDVTVTATLGGTYDHWHVMVDDDATSEAMPADGATHTFTGLYSGEHTIVAWAVDAAHAQVSEKVAVSVTI